MTLIESRHKSQLRQAGWRSRGYLPHFDGRAIPQFVTLHLFDSVPYAVLNKWRRELQTSDSPRNRILLHRRIERYLDLGYGQSFMKDQRIATIIQDVLMDSDNKSYRLFAWVVMPNHVHMLATRFEEFTLAGIMQSFKSITAHRANKALNRQGRFWMEEYFDRYIRNAEHFQKTIRYIEANPVKAGLCSRPEDWPFSSAWFRAHRS
jgi:REP element-mobilizing transposase RayT